MLIDQHNREVNYLRISVTERCNFRCLYCMPEKPFSWVPKEDLLNFEELFLFVKAAIDEGITKIRITGGEPTLREDLYKFIRMISKYAPDIDLALTTNGYLMKRYALLFKESGLKRVNMSLDSLQRDRVNKIAKKDVFNQVMEGIDASIEAGLKIKLNCVPMKGINDDEMVDILEFAKSKNIPIRFIEYMENSHAEDYVKGLNSDEMLEKIGSKYKFKKIPKPDFTSPAQYYELEDGYQFGVIEPHSDDFCSSCNRIRMSAEGDLIPCLYFDEALSIREAIRDKNINKAVEILKEVLANKPEKNRWSSDDENETSTRAFYETGG